MELRRRYVQRMRKIDPWHKRILANFSGGEGAESALPQNIVTAPEKLPILPELVACYQRTETQ